jgi:hypothetical protein
MNKKGEMSTREAGALGGAKVREKYKQELFKQAYQESRIKAARTIQNRYGQDYYKKIGAIGGARMRELIQKGKNLENSDQEN